MKRRWLCFILVLVSGVPLLAQNEPACAGSLPTRLKGVNQAMVISDSPLTIRQEADSTETLGELTEGDKVELIDGPVCGSLRQFTWWKVYVYDQAIVGWIAEANAVQYWLEPFEPTPVPTLPMRITRHGSLPLDEDIDVMLAANAVPVDEWTFTADQGDIYIFTIREALPSVTITDSDGELITLGDILNSPVNIASQYMLIAPKMDQYTLQLSTYAQGDDPGAYQLLGQHLDLAQDHMVNINSSVQGSFSKDDPLDSYEVWAFDGMKDKIAVFSASLSNDAGTSATLLLTDAEGRRLLYGAFAGDGSNRTQLGFVMDDVRYYLIVRSAFAGKYNLDYRLGTVRDLDSVPVTDFDLGMACPYIYTQDGNRWVYDTTILYRLVGANAKAEQARPLSRFDGHLLIREVEAESSYIDSLYILVTDAHGQIHRLDAGTPALAQDDGHDLVLHQGDAVELTFAGFAEIPDPKAAVVVAEGYYVPD